MLNLVMAETRFAPVEEEVPDLKTDRLQKWSADKPLNPSDLDLTPEQAEKISQEFEQKAFAETDLAKVVDGLIPSESLFNPDFIPDKISTPTAEVTVKKISGFKENVVNLFRKIAKFQAAAASYHPTKNEIEVRPKLDRFSTVASIAVGTFGSVLGPKLAHEVAHAFQDVDQPVPDAESTKQSMRRAVEMVKSEKGLSLAEAIALDGRSRDLAIVTESHAYVVSYMLTGSARPGEITMLRDLLAERSDADPQKVLMNDIPLTSYSENGFASVVDFVESNVKTYLPQKDQDNPDYLNRIRSVTTQIVKLLAIGASHRQIADLIRENHDSIHGGSQWNESDGGYQFLNLEKSDSLADKLPPDADLVAQFNQQTEARVLKLFKIAKDLINKS